jgi:hypothetical protein
MGYPQPAIAMVIIDYRYRQHESTSAITIACCP